MSYVWPTYWRSTSPVSTGCLDLVPIDSLEHAQFGHMIDRPVILKQESEYLGQPHKQISGKFADLYAIDDLANFPLPKGK